MTTAVCGLRKPAGASPWSCATAGPGCGICPVLSPPGWQPRLRVIRWDQRGLRPVRAPRAVLGGPLGRRPGRGPQPAGRGARALRESGPEGGTVRAFRGGRRACGTGLGWARQPIRPDPGQAAPHQARIEELRPRAGTARSPSCSGPRSSATGGSGSTPRRWRRPGSASTRTASRRSGPSSSGLARGRAGRSAAAPDPGPDHRGRTGPAATLGGRLPGTGAAPGDPGRLARCRAYPLAGGAGGGHRPLLDFLAAAVHP